MKLGKLHSALLVLFTMAALAGSSFAQNQQGQTVYRTVNAAAARMGAANLNTKKALTANNGRAFRGRSVAVVSTDAPQAETEASNYLHFAVASNAVGKDQKPLVTGAVAVRKVKGGYVAYHNRSKTKVNPTGRGRRPSR